jgi:hypothetical protein
VKCLIVPDADTQGAVAFRGGSFVPSPLTDFVVLAWRRDRAAFDDNAWLIPAADIPHLVEWIGPRPASNCALASLEEADSINTACLVRRSLPQSNSACAADGGL